MSRVARVLTQTAFDRLLQWLDDGANSQGDTYLEMRRRLVAYFDRRNRPAPDELADETLDRVARMLDEAGVIEVKPPARYCYVVARFVLLEDLRQREHANVPFDELRNADPTSTGDRQPDVTHEQRLACLDRCVEKLTPEQQELIVDYYRDETRQKIERRREMARRLGITMNALGIRACRIRDTLEACVGTCCRER